MQTKQLDIRKHRDHDNDISNKSVSQGTFKNAGLVFLYIALLSSSVSFPMLIISETTNQSAHTNIY